MNRIDYLRISLIDRCNFRCKYCIPDDTRTDYVRFFNLLTKEELLTLIKEVFIPLGFTRFRLTGGEPLLRSDIVELVQEIASLEQTQDLSMTTNGFLLAPLAKSIYQAGLRRINISLDSLNPETFTQIIGSRDLNKSWEKVWEGIREAYRVGFDPLKINVVVIPGVNDSEILDLAALSIDKNWHVRFIEFMPIGNIELFSDRAWLPSEELRRRISEKWGLEESIVQGAGPADIFKIPGAKGTLGFISQMSECFCDRCNRMRLSADGWLRPCLLNETGQIDLKTALREGVSTKYIQEQVRKIIEIKPEINYKERDAGNEDGVYTRTMSQIGG